MNHLQDQFATEARRVRLFLEVEGSRMNDLLRDFPRGACGNASDILSVWLKETCELQTQYVYGMREGILHGWLKSGDLLIDITSDQFADGLGPVYCGRSNSFYESFKDQKDGAVEISWLLRHVYQRMKDSFSSGG